MKITGVRTVTYEYPLRRPLGNAHNPTGTRRMGNLAVFLETDEELVGVAITFPRAERHVKALVNKVLVGLLIVCWWRGRQNRGGGARQGALQGIGLARLPRLRERRRWRLGWVQCIRHAVPRQRRRQIDRRRPAGVASEAEGAQVRFRQPVATPLRDRR